MANTGDGEQDSPIEGDVPEEDGAAPEEQRSKRRLWPRGWRGAALAGGLLLLIVVAFAGWLGLQATHAKSYLEQARSDAQQARDALSKANADEATKWVEAARSHAQQAQDATHSVSWNIASAVPWLGSPFKSGQQISDVVVGLSLIHI